MTLITFENGGPVLRSGKIGTGQECCGGCPCTCNNCEAHIYVNGVEVPFTPFTDFFGNPTCDPCKLIDASPNSYADIPCTETPPWGLTEACEEIFAGYLDCDEPQPDPENPLPRYDGCVSIECGYRAAACYLCENDQPTVRIHYFAIYTVNFATCEGGTETTTFVTRFWYRDYALPSLPPCDGPAVTLEQVGDDVDLWDTDCGQVAPGYGQGQMCGCDLTASILCIGPDFP